MKLVAAILCAATAALAAVFRADGQADDISPPPAPSWSITVSPASSLSDLTWSAAATSTITTTVDATAAADSSSSTSVSCDLSFCSENGVHYCMYWTMTTNDPWRGPKPGETIKSIGTCSVVSTTTATDAAYFIRRYGQGR